MSLHLNLGKILRVSYFSKMFQYLTLVELLIKEHDDNEGVTGIGSSKKSS